MTEEDPPDAGGDVRGGSASGDDRNGAPATDDGRSGEACGRMLARSWTIAARFREPADHGIPPLPEWTVYKEAGGGLAFGPEDGDDGIFIAAEDPVRVRR